MAEKHATEDAAIAASLDDEIESLQAQINSLKSERKLQAAAILSSQASHSILARLRDPNQANPSPNTTSTTTSTVSKNVQTSLPEDSNPLLTSSRLQSLHNQECTYRACATITTFRIQDPDPHAVNGGAVLGIRIDVGASGRFIRPYYIMLNKPYVGSNALRIHRHTLPPCIPIGGLAGRYLPPPGTSLASSSGATTQLSGEDSMKERKTGARRGQDLTRFVRALRREVVQYHNRITVIKALRKAFGLDEKVSEKGKGREKVLYDISAADAEAKQLRIEWVDGRIGRCVVGEKGEVLKCVVIGEEGRDRETERMVLGGDRRMEGIAMRLKAGVY
ncbi:Cenp-O kinetochore centromere component-domain-containing protein [Xylogone sp. PMI_703]|nr:Cenp-O kinetochore centromere component-domain-containing protein [Xylogone sp. PMI_703]